MTKNGRNRTHSSSIKRRPAGSKSRRPMGATGMGRHGAKYRASENGQSSATPSPPSVSASSSPCVATTAPTTRPIRAAGTGRDRAESASRAPQSAANANEVDDIEVRKAGRHDEERGPRRRPHGRSSQKSGGEANGDVADAGHVGRSV